MTLRFDGQVALVTGAGKGLGRAYALWLAARGASVVVNNRTHQGQPSSAQAVVDEILSAGGKAIADGHSVETEAGAAAMVQAAHSSFGRLDILVCNAAISVANTPIGETSLDQFRAVMDVNLWGTILPVYAAIPGMVAAGYGRVVLTTSHVALFGRTGSTAYGASKLGVVGFGRSLALEMEDQGILVNTVAPGAVTSMSSNLGPEFAERARPERVAPLVGWLCSSQCTESGMILSVMGGRARRVRFMESAIAELDEDNPGACMPILDDMTGAVEPRSAPEAGQSMLPGPRRFSPSAG